LPQLRSCPKSGDEHDENSLHYLEDVCNPGSPECRWSTLGAMADLGEGRVAVYLDFDNIVISRYDQVNGRSSFQKDKAKGLDKYPDRLAQATVDVGAIIDFASSFGTLVLTRAYADWSADVNTGYREQLVGRAVDLVQLFPAAAYGKNAADIRLAVDAVEDMFRLPDLTHVVIVAGDSDYIPLAQRCKRLGRYVVGVGVAGSSSRSLAAACDEFVIYDALPGVPVPEPKRHARAKDTDADEPPPPDPQAAATDLLTRALRIGLEKDDADWLHNSAVKAQMKRMDPSFSEKSLGFRSFSDFLRSRSDLVELDESSTTRMVRLR
jgi:NYN domain/OST-HTH/LOTUS domain